jgi:hypothetical protein
VTQKPKYLTTSDSGVPIQVSNSSTTFMRSSHLRLILCQSLVASSPHFVSIVSCRPWIVCDRMVQCWGDRD